MKVTVIRFRDLADDDRRHWAALQQSAAAPLNSPFFHPQFSAAVDAVRGDVEVGILKRGGRTVGYFPFHRTSRNIGKPVGLCLNDFQGPILQPGIPCDLQAIVRGCGLRAYDFDHAPAAQTCFGPFVALSDGSPYLALAESAERFELTALLTANDRRDTGRRERRLAESVGPIRVEHGLRDPAVARLLFRWKRRQFARTGVPDALAESWVRRVVESYLDFSAGEFAGVLSGLWAGEQLIAAELGLRSGGVYHMQWCAYDEDFQAYSPGRLLLHRSISYGAENGVRWYDFGKGMAEYKTRLMTGHTLVGAGCVATSLTSRALRGSWWTARRWLRQSPLRAHAKRLAGYYFDLRKSALLAKRGA